MDGYAPIFVFSGGFGRLTDKSWKKSEGETFAEIAIKMGVPQDSIIIENKSTNTGENIDYSLKILTEKGLTPKSVILITKPYMERRAYATFKKLFPEIEVKVTSPQISFEDYPNETISNEEMINIMVGDTQRIRIYPEKGFMIKQEIPEEVWQAFEGLVNKGFTRHLISQ